MTTDISFYFFSFLGVLFLAALVYLFLFLTKLQRREEVNYSLQLALLLVVVPLHRKDKAVGDVEMKKLIGVMEQFYAGIAEVKQGWVKGMFRGPSALSFEIVLPAIGEEVHFYLAVPRKYV